MAAKESEEAERAEKAKARARAVAEAEVEAKAEAEAEMIAEAEAEAKAIAEAEAEAQTMVAQMARAHTLAEIDETEGAANGKQDPLSISDDPALDAPHSMLDGTASMSRTGLLPKVDDHQDASVDESVMNEDVEHLEEDIEQAVEI